MKRYFVIPMLCVISNSALAQEKSGIENQAIKADSHLHHSAELRTVLMPTSKLIGASLKDANSEECGTINGFVFDKSGKVAFVIVGQGGVLGIGEDEIALPWSAFQCDCTMLEGKMTCHPSVSLHGKQLANANRLKAKKYLELTDAKWIAENDKFFGVTEASTPMLSRIATNNFINAKVFSNDEKESGVLDEFMIENGTGRATVVVVGLGGIAGVGKEFVAIPFSKLALSVSDDKHLAKVRFSQAELKSAQKVTAGEYPELRLTSVLEKLQATSGR